LLLSYDPPFWFPPGDLPKKKGIGPYIPEQNAARNTLPPSGKFATNSAQPTISPRFTHILAPEADRVFLREELSVPGEIKITIWQAGLPIHVSARGLVQQLPGHQSIPTPCYEILI